MVRAVIDSNVYISGLLFGGNPGKIIELAIEGRFQSCISSDILHEIKEVLERDKFGFSENITRQIVREIESLSEIVNPKKKHKESSRDPGDNIIIDCAVEAGADFIITGDSDLLILKEFQDIKIVNPAEFMKMYE